ncbi:hypothetical protein Patl1_19704 [Pistacia atlantica]|uniref:Uncharacterized protein n=1 Tax=Pistacia atlantica TaxID=434234 RepID=A0ACC1BZV4_9ROSI|nr:hypothetical protein Patl1_19704 [Pistacia atlantica]
MRQRVGRWTPDEDKRLTAAAILFGPKNWKKMAQFVPGRTQVQCRGRWVNSLDPSVNRGEWTEEEDLMLEAALEEHGFSWSKVAAALPRRTDNQCWRRWKYLHPDEVPVLQARRKMQKAAPISSFVDRERERPALGLNDFVPLALTNSASKLGDRPLKLPPKMKLCMKLGKVRNGGENISLESIRELSSRSYPEHLLEASDGEDGTLACFLRNELKKRKLKAPEAGSSSESLLLSKSIDQHSSDRKQYNIILVFINNN